jgi:transposase-like protein
VNQPGRTGCHESPAGPACPSCGAGTAPELGPGHEVTVGTVAGLIGPRPRWRCHAGHRTAAAAVAGGADQARSQVRAAVPYARARRLRRVETCSVCDEPLTMPVRRTDWPVVLEGLGGAPGVATVRLDVPATRCPACGTDHVPVRSQGDLEAAVLALLCDDAAPTRDQP